ncbi:MAG TPA: glycosyltransferase family 2 protein [Pyrinomonadaceae bacterium]|nr:glycosyltransferase family 2 protein [Pyrinomonadaceae bacterium]
MRKRATPAGAAESARVEERRAGTILVEAGREACDLASRLERLFASTDNGAQRVVVVVQDSDGAALPPQFSSLDVLLLPRAHPERHAALCLGEVRTDKVAFLSAGATLDAPAWEDLPADGASLMFWLPEIPSPRLTAREDEAERKCWVASVPLLRGLSELGGCADWETLRVADAARRAGREVFWRSPAAAAEDEDTATPHAGGPLPISEESEVAALIPHYRCEEWLAQCLESVLAQTRPLEAVVVIDDCSEHPPVEIVSRYEGVTLLRSEENVGWCRLVDEAIGLTGYDAYLFQDADDWSANDRLEILLREAARTGAELIGSQEVRVVDEGVKVLAVNYPLDVSRAYAEFEAHPLLHPTSLVARALVRRVGGFATAMRFGGDSEFLRRVGRFARIVNAPRYCYFRRDRPGAMTRVAETGLQSEARATLIRELQRWADENREAVARGELRHDEVKPYAKAPPMKLTHLLGPRLKPGADGRRAILQSETRTRIS